MACEGCKLLQLCCRQAMGELLIHEVHWMMMCCSAWVQSQGSSFNLPNMLTLRYRGSEPSHGSQASKTFGDSNLGRDVKRSDIVLFHTECSGSDGVITNNYVCVFWGKWCPIYKLVLCWSISCGGYVSNPALIADQKQQPHFQVHDLSCTGPHWHRPEANQRNQASNPRILHETFLPLSIRQLTGFLLKLTVAVWINFWPLIV